MSKNKAVIKIKIPNCSLSSDQRALFERNEYHRQFKKLNLPSNTSIVKRSQICKFDIEKLKSETVNIYVEY